MKNAWRNFFSNARTETTDRRREMTAIVSSDVTVLHFRNFGFDGRTWMFMCVICELICMDIVIGGLPCCCCCCCCCCWSCCWYCCCCSCCICASCCAETCRTSWGDWPFGLKQCRSKLLFWINQNSYISEFSVGNLSVFTKISLKPHRYVGWVRNVRLLCVCVGRRDESSSLTHRHLSRSGNHSVHRLPADFLNRMEDEKP